MLVIKFIQKNIWLFILGLLFSTRFLFLDFGLPFTFQADEVEMVEYSLKYSVNIKKLFVGDFYFFKPFSFVYGTLPAYLNSILLIPFLKITSIFSLSQDRYYIYLYLRVIYAIFSILTCVGVFYLAKQMSKDKNISFLATILFSLNFYFYWMGKYLNNDVLVVLFTIFFLLYYLKFKELGKNLYFYLAMLFLGFGVSTKITFGIAIIYPFLELLIKKDFKKILIVVGIIFSIYLITNPFTFIFTNEFIQRVMEMRIKENGIVIDSYNTSYFKYLFSLFDVITIPVCIFSLYFVIEKIIKKKFDITIFIVLFYLLFFSFSNRLVDRWLLPIYPILIIISLQFLDKFKQKFLKKVILFLIIFQTLGQFVLANYELSLNSNMLKSYYSFKENLTTKPAKVYLITERGLNPYTSLNIADLSLTTQQFIPYVSENAFNLFPYNPENYDYVIFSSKVRRYYSNPYIYKLNPEYYSRWEKFYQDLNSDKFEKVSSFETPFPSALDQENIYIFRKK